MTPKLQNRIEDLMARFAKMELWTGAIANRSLEQHQQRANRNMAAEDAAVRKSAGWPEPAEGDEMGDTIVGDVNIQQQPSTGRGGGLAKLALATVLGAAIPGAGIAGYLLQAADTVADADTDTNTDIGLGRIEDYLK